MTKLKHAYEAGICLVCLKIFIKRSKRQVVCNKPCRLADMYKKPKDFPTINGGSINGIHYGNQLLNG